LKKKLSLKLKELANVDESKSSIVSLGKNGKESLTLGFTKNKIKII
jgi:hypothetical protein